MCLGEIPRTGCGYARKALGVHRGLHGTRGRVVEGSCSGWGLFLLLRLTQFRGCVWIGMMEVLDLYCGYRRNLLQIICLALKECYFG